MPSGVYPRNESNMRRTLTRLQSLEYRQSISADLKSRWLDTEYREKKSAEWLGKRGELRKERIKTGVKIAFERPEVRAKLGKHWLGKKLSPEHRAKILRRRTPSGLETRVLDLVQRYSLPYSYVGNGSYWIEDKNPDFVRNDHRKQVVEVYAAFQKIQNYGNVDNYRFQRSFHYKQFGYETVFLSEEDIFASDWETRCLAKLV